MSARLPYPAGHEDARAGHEPDRDRAPEGQHLEVEGVDGAGEVAHGGEARLEHEPRVLRRVEGEELGAGAHLGPDRVRLVGVDHTDEVDVEIHEPGHHGGRAGLKPRPAPVDHFGCGRHALHAAIPDHQRHLSPGAGPGPVPQAVGHEEEAVHRDVVSREVGGAGSDIGR